VSTALIQGWVTGISGMRVGGRRELIIPPALAYKNTAQPKIPANSTLIFIVDLLGVTPASGG
jgi:peptidylprolyl isomerase